MKRKKPTIETRKQNKTEKKRENIEQDSGNAYLKRNYKTRGMFTCVMYPKY